MIARMLTTLALLLLMPIVGYAGTPTGAYLVSDTQGTQYQAHDRTGHPWHDPDLARLESWINHVNTLLIAAETLGLDRPSPGELKAIPLPTPVKLTVPPVPTKTTPASGDPYGFGAWLNNERARRGLHALAYDAGLAYDAQINSGKGFSHFYMGHATRQNAGQGTAAQVWPLWIASPPHAAALFDPNVRLYGIAAVGNVWTYNAR